MFYHNLKSLRSKLRNFNIYNLVSPLNRTNSIVSIISLSNKISFFLLTVHFHYSMFVDWKHDFTP
jgi:hypothetical protein